MAAPIRVTAATTTATAARQYPDSPFIIESSSTFDTGPCPTREPPTITPSIERPSAAHPPFSGHPGLIAFLNGGSGEVTGELLRPPNPHVEQSYGQ
jgi:hypothetical protein